MKLAEVGTYGVETKCTWLGPHVVDQFEAIEKSGLTIVEMHGYDDKIFFKVGPDKPVYTNYGASMVDVTELSCEYFACSDFERWYFDDEVLLKQACELLEQGLIEQEVEPHYKFDMFELDLPGIGFYITQWQSDIDITNF